MDNKSDSDSIHSIVTDKDNFDSDNEAPEDKKGQVDKIIKNHVIKKIIKPGRGFAKVSKNDYVELRYKIYFNDLSELHGFIDRKDYIYNLRLPIGVISAIKHMRQGEYAKILVRPKHGFKKIDNEKFYNHIEMIDYDNIDLLNRIKKSELNYEIELINFKQIYDLNADKMLMKEIIKQGEGVIKPFEENELKFNLKIFCEEIIIHEEFYTKILNNENFTDYEMIMLKSMKKNELSRIEINNIVWDNILNNSSLLKGKELSRKEKTTVVYEIELLKFKQKISIIHINDVAYKKTILNKGIGYICPWKNASVMLMFHVIHNNNLIYSDFEKDRSYQETVELIKGLKAEVKAIKRFEMNIQFIIDKKINLKDNIYDTLHLKLPDIITDSISSMKILEIQNLKFKGKLDYFKIQNSDIEILDQVGEYDITYCLLNFQENFNLFNKSIYSNDQRHEKIHFFRNLANYYFSKNLFNKAFKINHYLVDEYIKYLNLFNKDRLSRNKEKIENCININITDIPDETKLELKKSHSNLILILYKLKELKKCNEYIDLFFISQDNNDEKVLYYKYKTLFSMNKYNECKIFLERLCELNQQYNDCLNEVNVILNENKKKKDNFIKKMFKFIK